MADAKKNMNIVRPAAVRLELDANHVAYRGAIPMKGFIGWVLMVVCGAGLVAFLAANVLVNQRLGQLVDETAARVDLQAQGRSGIIGEWLAGVTRAGDAVAKADLVRMYVADVAQPEPVSGTVVDAEEVAALRAQKPYMQQMMKEFVARNKLSGASMLLAEGQVLLSAGATDEAVAQNKAEVLDVVRTAAGTVRPLRMDKSGVIVLDILRPIVAPQVDDGAAGARVVGVLWMSMPVGEKLAELVAATPLDRTGERSAIVQRLEGNAEVVGRTALAPLGENYADVERRLEAGRVVQGSVVDGRPVFATLKPIVGTPLALLQEYAADQALGVMKLYKPGLYLIVALAVGVLAAMMLALTLHLMAQRNKTRVRLLGQTMEALVRVVEARDPYLAGHHDHVARLAVQVGNLLHLGVGERATLFYAAQLSSVGRLLVPRPMLVKKAKLNAEERKDLEQHIDRAMGILDGLDFDLPVAAVIAQMYERVDGSGHPHAMKGSEMSLMGKVLGACDAFVAMTHARAHREAMSREEALKQMTKGFDREVLVALERVG